MLSLQRREHRQAWVLLAPMLIAMFILTAWPLARTLWLSFTDTALAGSGEATHYVWLDNYLYALTDPDFRAAFARTLYFTVVSVAIEGAIGVLVALLLNQRFVGRNVLRVLVILPWALPTIVNAMMWRLNFNPDYGSVNALLSQLGLIDSYRSWLGSPDSALHAVMLADIWKNYPLVTLLVLAAPAVCSRRSVRGGAARRRLGLAAFSRHYLSGHCGSPWRRAGATHHRCLQSVRHYLCYDPRRPALTVPKR